MLYTVLAFLLLIIDLFMTILGAIQDYRAEKLLCEIKGVKNAKN